MARITLHMRNGKEIDFESAIFKPLLDQATGRILGAEFFKKDNGVSLLYADWTEVLAVTKDTRKDE